MVSFPKRYQYHQIGTSPPNGQSRHYRLPLVLPYPTSLQDFFTSPTSYPDSFRSFILEWALRLPTSFSISGLARLGSETKTCRSSWRAFASTHPLMLSSTSPRDALLACPPSSPWNLPSFTVKSTYSSPCSRSDFPLSPKCGFAHLDFLSPYDLMLWTDDSGVLTNCFLCVALRPLFPFQKAQYAYGFPLKPAPFRKLRATRAHK